MDMPITQRVEEGDTKVNSARIISTRVVFENCDIVKVHRVEYKGPQNSFVLLESNKANLGLNSFTPKRKKNVPVKFTFSVGNFSL